MVGRPQDLRVTNRDKGPLSVEAAVPGGGAAGLIINASCLNSAIDTGLTGRRTAQILTQSQRHESMSGSGYPKFRNDRGVPEIRIGVREFKCIGVSPPLDHPHVYINIGEAETILCPYCATRFRFDPRLTPLGADPPDSYFVNHN